MMKAVNKYAKFMSIATIFCLLSTGCAVRQNIQPRVLKPANSIANSHTRGGISVAAAPYIYPGQGVDYIKAGIHPVQVVVTNNSKASLMLSPGQVVAQGTDGNMYLTYMPQEAMQLVLNSQALEEAAKGAAAGAVAGAAVGALAGLAFGAIFNGNLGQWAGAGALGGGLGGVGGGIRAYQESLARAVQAEVTNNSLRQTVIGPGFTATGWLYFPTVSPYRELRIALVEVGGDSKVHTFRVNMPASHITQKVQTTKKKKHPVAADSPFVNP